MAHRPDVTELLTDQHAETERLLAAYEAAREPERRAALADAVVTALQRRARAEEDLIAPVARRVLPEGERLAGAVAGQQAAAVRAARRLRGTGWVSRSPGGCPARSRWEGARKTAGFDPWPKGYPLRRRGPARSPGRPRRPTTGRRSRAVDRVPIRPHMPRQPTGADPQPIRLTDS